MPQQVEGFDILKEFGLENLSEDKKAGLQQQIIEVIESRFSRVILNRLPEEDKKELDKLLAGNDSEQMNKFMAAKVPDYAGIYKKIVEDLKEEMLKVRDAISQK